MHLEAHAGVGWAIERSGLDRHSPLRILDIGGQNINGTAHDWFTHPDTTIKTLDLENADIIADAMTWFPTEHFDVVLATEVFEHVEDWTAVLMTMAAALAPGGVLISTCASDNRPAHGATGAPTPAEGEWYQNVPPGDLDAMLRSSFPTSEVKYQYPPGDAYLWATDHQPLPVSLLIPSIPSRKVYLRAALKSAQDQVYRPAEVLVEFDDDQEGPAVVRNRLLAKARHDWVAFLDDDDWLLPDHLYSLVKAQQQTGADLVWPWFQVEGGSDPFPAHRGRQWDPSDPHIFPITVLACKRALLDAGGFTTGQRVDHQDRPISGEDWRLWNAMSLNGAKFHHLDQVTWVWRHHSGNTSGLPSRR